MSIFFILKKKIKEEFLEKIKFKEVEQLHKNFEAVTFLKYISGCSKNFFKKNWPYPAISFRVEYNT